MIPAALLACAMNVSPITLNLMACVESMFNPVAIRVNGLPAQMQPHVRTIDEAVRVSKRYIARGYRVDMGMLQIDSENLKMLDMSVRQAFNPCHNVAGGGKIITEDYQAAATRFGRGQTALRAALSAYNTGNFYSGMSNGYVARYYRCGGGHAPPPAIAVPIPAAEPNPYTAPMTVNFAVAGGSNAVVK